MLRPVTLAQKAISIEALLVWTYRDQKADVWWDSHQGLFMGEQALAVRKPLGFQSSYNGVADRDPVDDCAVTRALVPWSIPDDAQRVHRQVRALSRRDQALVVMHGRRADRPDAYLGELPRLTAKRWRAKAEGKEAVTVMHPKTKRGWYCEVEVSPDPRDMLAARTLYSAWRDTLRALAWSLRAAAALELFAVTEALPPLAEPLPGWAMDYIARAGEGTPRSELAPARHVVVFSEERKRIA